MSFLTGKCFSGSDSSVTEARCHLSDDGKLTLTINGIVSDFERNELEISSRLGNTPRKIRFPDGSMFETTANQAIDDWLGKSHTRSLSLHRLESNLLLGLCGVAFIAVFTWWFLTDGLPRTARYIAFQLPSSTMESLGSQAQQIVEWSGMENSELDIQKQAHVRMLFNDLVKKTGMRDSNCRIEFYHAEESFGPNAFALPPCLILATDEFIELAANDDELRAVFAHEIGHIHERHSLRRVVQGSVLSFAVFLMTGDATQLPADLLGTSAVFMELGYTRDYEREADRYAHAYMTKHDIPLHSFPDILRRMEAWVPPETSESCKTDPDVRIASLDTDHREGESDNSATSHVQEDLHEHEEVVQDDKTDNSKNSKRWSVKFTNYFSSHPDTEERAQLFSSNKTIKGH